MSRAPRKNRRSVRFSPAPVVRQVSECLESRALLTVGFTISGTNLNVTGDAMDNDITVQDNGATVELVGNFATIDTGVARAAITSVAVRGNAGNDTLTISPTMLTVKSFLYGNDGDDVLNGGSGNDTLRGGLGADAGFGGDGNDSLQAGQGDFGGTGDAGQDTVVFVDDFAVAGDLLAGIVIAVPDGTGIETIIGAGGPDVIDCSAVTTKIVLSGGGGNDTLTGGSGNDSLNGGAGDDLLFGNDGNDSFAEGLGNDNIDGGAGSDTIGYSTAPGGVAVNLGTAPYTTGQAVPVVLAASTAETGAWGTDSILGIEGVNGSAFDDILVGSAADDEQLKGNGGNDWLAGLGGEDNMDGGAGIDTADYSASPVGVQVNRVDNALESGGDAQNDRVYTCENVVGSEFDDVLIGDGNANGLYGRGGNDSINGGGGNDSLWGGLGNDTLTGAAGTDNIDGGADDDTVFADSLDDQAATFTGGAGIDVLKAASNTIAVDWVLSDASLFEQLNGSNMADSINASTVTGISMTFFGANGDDMIWGGAMDDVLNGGLDNDTIYGGAGADILRGNAGADWLYGNDLANTDDLVQDRMFGNTGLDTVTGRLPDSFDDFSLLDADVNLIV